MIPDEDPTMNDFDDPETEVETEIPADDFVHYEAFEAQNRLWIRAIVPIMQLRAPEAHGNARVRFAFDRLQIAACERLARILSSDLPTVEA